MCPWQICSAWEKINLDCPTSLISTLFILSIYFPGPSFSFPQAWHYGLEWKLHIRLEKKRLWTHENPRVAFMLPLIFLFCCFGERCYGERCCCWEICVTEAFSWPVYHFCKMWDMRDINTLPRYPCLHPFTWLLWLQTAHLLWLLMIRLVIRVLWVLLTLLCW